MRCRMQKALDKAVAEATEQRKEEHSTFLQMQAENQAATQLIEAAKNKLYKSAALPRALLCDCLFLTDPSLASSQGCMNQ